MKVLSDEFFKWCDSSSQMYNMNPEYVPCKEEIEELWALTEKKRDDSMQNVEKKTGRPLKSDTSPYRFIKHGKKGSPYVTEENFFRFLVFISEKASPTTKEGIDNLAYLNKYLRENLILV